jgi:hypothetical protein
MIYRFWRQLTSFQSLQTDNGPIKWILSYPLSYTQPYNDTVACTNSVTGEFMPNNMFDLAPCKTWRSHLIFYIFYHHADALSYAQPYNDPLACTNLFAREFMPRNSMIDFAICKIWTSHDLFYNTDAFSYAQPYNDTLPSSHAVTGEFVSNNFSICKIWTSHLILCIRRPFLPHSALR